MINSENTDTVQSTLPITHDRGDSIKRSSMADAPTGTMHPSAFDELCYEIFLLPTDLLLRSVLQLQKAGLSGTAACWLL